MTLNEAIAKIDSLKPNQYTFAEKVAWISDVDGRIYRDLITKHENPEEKTWDGPYDEDSSSALVLLAYEPYTDLYIYYMMAMIDQYNGEYTRYSNDMEQFNNSYQAFADDYIRNYKSVMEHKFRL
jgi:hypothetical protein